MADSPAASQFPKYLPARDCEKSENNQPNHLSSLWICQYSRIWLFVNLGLSATTSLFPTPRTPLPQHTSSLLACLEKMYESVDVAHLNSSPNPFFMMDFYNQNRACLIQEKGAGNPNPYGTPLRNQHWNSSNHCTYNGISLGLGPTGVSPSFPLSPAFLV